MEFESQIGKTCDIETCKKLDFLPYTCAQCKLNFCDEHKHPSSHSCPVDSETFQKVIVCPICLESIPCKSSQDPNLIFSIHAASNCNPENYQKKKEKMSKKCSFSDCKVKLNNVNVFDCSKCRNQFCLSHRFPESHSCRTNIPLQRETPQSMVQASEVCGFCGMVCRDLNSLISHANLVHCPN